MKIKLKEACEKNDVLGVAKERIEDGESAI